METNVLKLFYNQAYNCPVLKWSYFAASCSTGVRYSITCGVPFRSHKMLSIKIKTSATQNVKKIKINVGHLIRRARHFSANL